MNSFESLADWQIFRQSETHTLGFVPTMGALHQGHLSLIRRSLKETQKTVVSIFVNPTQFSDSNDLQNYPRPLAKDIELLRREGVNYLLLPTYPELYADGYRFQVHESATSKILCGQHRPGHFTGVLTVVMKLLNIVQANKAYFGEKDYQQYLLIREMAQAFFIPTEIVACATVRESDGLAMSSRNLLLTDEQRSIAKNLFQILKSATDTHAARTDLEKIGFKVDYLEEHFGRRFVAAHLGSVRLIDNVQI